MPLDKIKDVYTKGGLSAAFHYTKNKGMSDIGKGALETLKTSFSAKVIAATAAFIAMKAAWDYFNDKFNLTFDAAMTNAEEAYSAFSEAELLQTYKKQGIFTEFICKICLSIETFHILENFP